MTTRGTSRVTGTWRRATSDTLVVMGSINDRAGVLATDRALAVADAERGGAEAAALFEIYGDPVFRTVSASGDLAAGVITCGQVVGLVHDLPSAGDIVARVATEARTAVARVAAMFTP